MDFFVVPTMTARLLFVLVVMQGEWRKIVHFNTTDAPTAARTAQQAINASPYDTAPESLLRDRDPIHGSLFVQWGEGMGIKQKLISPRSPWQNPFIERLVGSIRREGLNRAIKHPQRREDGCFFGRGGFSAPQRPWPKRERTGFGPLGAGAFPRLNQ
jgi:transposase InsO family protein